MVSLHNPAHFFRGSSAQLSTTKRLEHSAIGRRREGAGQGSEAAPAFRTIVVILDPVGRQLLQQQAASDIRGLARYEADLIAPDATLSDLMPNGVLALTVDPTEGQRYQGLVEDEALGEVGIR